MTYLLDINVLVALFDAQHVHHESAHRWFATTGSASWASCPITQNGFIRVISNPAYPSVTTTVSEAAKRLRLLCSQPGHTFWADDVAVTDDSHFDLSKLRGHQQITDAYLVGLAAYAGKLATFDAAIPLAAVNGASPKLLELIPTA